MEFSLNHRKGKGPRKGSVCSVVNCDSKKNINTNLSFHKVPKSGSGTVAIKNLGGDTIVVEKRSEWLKRLKIKDTDQQLLVCSLHFSVDDYVFPDVPATRRYLEKNAVPVAISVSVERRKVNISRIKRLNSRRDLEEKKRAAKGKQSKKETNENNVESDPVSNLINPSISTDVLSGTAVEICHFDEGVFRHNIDAGISVADMLKNISEPDQHDPDCEDSNLEDSINETATFEDIKFVDFKNVQMDEEHRSISYNKCQNDTHADQSTQVTSGDFIVSFCTFIKTEQDLETMCNINSFAILDELVKSMEKCFPRKRKYILTTRECIILTTAKLKLDISFAALSVLFNQICVVTLRNVFYDTIKKLATILQSVITQVSEEEIMNNMPTCFDKYQNTTSVFNCTEIGIQQPECLKCCLKFYSHYKGGLTVKFVTEVTPGGMIVGISKAFGGRVSDESIFNQTNVVPKLESTRDAIMVDEEFLIDNECAERRIKLIAPPFFRSQKQLAEKELIENKDIARARVHMERMNQRIKQFQILNHKLHWYLANYIDDIFIICCGLANLGTLILADVKFE